MQGLLSKVFAFIFLFALCERASAQDSIQLRTHINQLASKGMFGRGYVGKGMQKAGRYVAQQYAAAGLQYFGKSYAQAFTYPVNTFPSVMDVKVEDKTLTAGVDYLVHPASKGFQAEKLKVKIIDGRTFVEKGAKNPAKEWQKWQKKMSKKKYAYLLTNMDTVKSLMEWKSNNRDLVQQLPEGVFLTQHKVKPIWSVAANPVAATLIELYDSTLLLKKNNKLEVTIINQHVPKFEAENLIGFVPGTERPDSFIIITAHYDHIGKMGNKAMFPGASDNASGTAMLLSLAKHYADTPAKYTMVFMAFAGEEAGLLGSKFFVENPSFNLGQIKFLINLDILGDATDGISVVNGESHRDEFQMLAALNQTAESGQVLKEVRRGGAAANSDHHHFSEKGVPAFFIFSMGGKGYYHDIWDKAEHVTLKNVPAVGQLLKRFIQTF